MNLTKLIFSSLVFSSLIAFGQQSISETTKTELLKENTELKVQNEKHKSIISLKRK